MLFFHHTKSALFTPACSDCALWNAHLLLEQSTCGFCTPVGQPTPAETSFSNTLVIKETKESGPRPKTQGFLVSFSISIKLECKQNKSARKCIQSFLNAYPSQAQGFVEPFGVQSWFWAPYIWNLDLKWRAGCCRPQGRHGSFELVKGGVSQWLRGWLPS